MEISKYINAVDVDKLKKEVQRSKPFEYFCIDNFLKEPFAEQVFQSYPSYIQASQIGKGFNAVNEKKKIQITDSSLFPDSIKILNEILLSKQFLSILSEVFNITDLTSDPSLVGGGIHETQEGGRLDVHIDFNYDDGLKLYRRINFLLYFNKEWKEEYGGILDLWDKDVSQCYAEIMPVFNRAVCFATSEISYHGVTPITAPTGTVRKSFAAYYYTKDAPEGWSGTHHSTIFKARPDEWMKKRVYMPAEAMQRRTSKVASKFKTIAKSLLGKQAK